MTKMELTHFATKLLHLLTYSLMNDIENYHLLLKDKQLLYSKHEEIPARDISMANSCPIFISKLLSARYEQYYLSR